MLTYLKNSWFNLAAFSLLFFAIFAWTWTGSLLFLGIPIAFLFTTLAGVNWKLAYWIFLFTIPFSIQIDLAGDSMAITLPDQPIMWLFLLVFIVMYARNPKIIPEWWWRDKLVFVSALQFFWIVVSVICSQIVFYSIKFLLLKTWLVVCFLLMPALIFKEKKDYVIGFKMLFISTLLTVIVILIHHAMLGFRFEKVQKSLHIASDLTLYYNHVDYSSVTSQLFPLLIVAFWYCRKSNWYIKWSLILVILIYIAGIIFAQTRAAYIAVFFGFAVGVAIRLKLVNLIMPTIYGLIAAMLVFMISNNKFMDFRPDYNKTYMHRDFASHLISTLRGRDMSSMERVYRWIAAIRMSKEHPFVGVGPRNFYYYYKPYAVTSFRTYVSRNPERSTTHNYYLYMLVEQGYPAMFLYALLIPMIFAKAQKTYHRFKDKFYRTVTIGLAMTIGAAFINNFFSELIETHKVGALFYIPLALLILLDRKSRELEAEEQTIQEPIKA